MIKAKSKTIVKNNKGKKKIIEATQKIRKDLPIVKIGIQSDSGQYSEDGLRVVDVATFHEFGTKNIPERSFIRSNMKKNRKKYLALTAKMYSKMMKGEITPEKALALIGEVIQADIKKGIIEGIPPELSKETIKKKGSSTPLIDTGQMMNSIRYKVVKK